MISVGMPFNTTLEKQTFHREDLPGDLAIWIFIYAELLVFGVLFITYIVVRSQNVELFNDSQLTLNKTLGLLNTLLLLSSSYFVVKSLHAIKQDKKDKCIFWLIMSIVAGLGFVGLKTYEFINKSEEGINLSTNLFYTYYLSMTFFHFMHVILGLIILSAVLIKAKLGGYSATNYFGIETGASYWHMVDLVWIVLFPLIYLLR